MTTPPARAYGAARRLAGRIRRKIFWAVRGGPSPWAIVRLDDTWLVVPARYVEHYVFRSYEPLARNALRSFLRPGMTFVDVGAHVGSYTVLGAKCVGPTGRVHAIEPWQENVEIVRANLALNEIRNVTLHAVAAGSRRETRSFKVTAASDSHGFYSHPLTETVRTVQTQVVPVAQLVNGAIDAAKIDVEGAELEVLVGMRRVLADSPTCGLLVEWNPACLRNAGVELVDVFDRLRELGLTRVTVIDDYAGRTMSVDQALALDAAVPPPTWYANIWATRG